MSIRKIVTDKDPQLRMKSRNVEIFDERLGRILDDLRDTMRVAQGVGLAAPQVGILRNYAVVEVDDLYLELINPRIITTSGSQTCAEGCLSVPERHAEVTRPYLVTVEYQDRFGRSKSATVEGMVARVCCHEIDHLVGVLFYDRENK